MGTTALPGTTSFLKDDDLPLRTSGEKYRQAISSGEQNFHTEDDEQEYITGFRLAFVLISGTLVQFTLMLDASIIATVCVLAKSV